MKVTQKCLVDSVSLNQSEITLDHIGKVYELPITPNTFTYVEGAEPLDTLAVSIEPSNADEKKVLWYSFDRDIIRIDSGFYNGQRYQTLTVVGTGTTKLYAYDWYENGKHAECTVYVPPKVTVLSCSPSGWIESSEIMGRDMATEFNYEESYVVKTPTNTSLFETCWKEAGECIIIHTHGSPEGLYDHGIGSTPIIVSKGNISNLPVNTAIRFIMMTACETAGGTESDNVAYWLSKKINPNGIVIANTDIVSGGSTSFRGTNSNPTWKIYKNGIIQAPIYDVTLTMQSAYRIYELYK